VKPVTYPPIDPRTEQVKTEQSKRDLFRAGEWALWVWIVVTVIPAVILLGCCALCGLSAAGSMAGGAAS
jgi:hypothetical protein